MDRGILYSVGESREGGFSVEPGAYARSLKALSEHNRSVKMLWQHDPTQPIGVWDEVREDERGLYVKGRILADVAKGREAVALLEAGAQVCACDPEAMDEARAAQRHSCAPAWHAKSAGASMSGGVDLCLYQPSLTAGQKCHNRGPPWLLNFPIFLTPTTRWPDLA